MTKKRFATLATCIALVGAVAVGGTLALLTAPSNAVKNTFAVGQGYVDPEQALKLDENIPTQDAAGNYVSGDTRTESGVNYDKLVNNTTLAKDPTFTLAAGSPDSWIVAKIDTVDTAFTGSKFTENGWYKVSGTGTTEDPYKATKVTGDTPIEAGLYIYGGTVKAGEKTTPLFTTLSYTERTESGVAVNPTAMNIKGCAVQAVGDSQTVDTAVDTVVKAAVTAMNQE